MFHDRQVESSRKRSMLSTVRQRGFMGWDGAVHLVFLKPSVLWIGDACPAGSGHFGKGDPPSICLAFLLLGGCDRVTKLRALPAQRM